MTDIHQEIDFWSISTSELFGRLGSNKTSGLSSYQVKEKLRTHGKNVVKATKKKDSISLLISQFKSPIIVIFIVTAAVSFFWAKRKIT